MKRFISFVLAALMLLSAVGFVGCGEEKKESESVVLDMTKIYADFEKTLPEMTMMDETMMLNFCGIDKADCKQAVVSVCSDGLKADEIWLIEANGTETLEKLKGLAENRLERKDEESITYSPEQNKVVKSAEIIVSGNYLAMICSPDVEALAASYRTAAGIDK